MARVDRRRCTARPGFRPRIPSLAHRSRRPRHPRHAHRFPRQESRRSSYRQCRCTRLHRRSRPGSAPPDPTRLEGRIRRALVIRSVRGVLAADERAAVVPRRDRRTGEGVEVVGREATARVRGPVRGAGRLSIRAAELRAETRPGHREREAVDAAVAGRSVATRVAVPVGRDVGGKVRAGVRHDVDAQVRTGVDPTSALSPSPPVDCGLDQRAATAENDRCQTDDTNVKPSDHRPCGSQQ